MASFNHGGITRSIEMPCGWSSIGSVREVNGKIRIHKKYCEMFIKF